MVVCYYEVYEIGSSESGYKFRTKTECKDYIHAQVELSKLVYENPYKPEDFEIIPHTYMSVKDIMSDMYGQVDEEVDRKLKELFE